MLSPATQPQRDAAHAALAADGVPVTVIQDSPGFVARITTIVKQARVDATSAHSRPRGKVGIVAIDADGFRRLPTKIYGQPDFCKRGGVGVNGLAQIYSEVGLGSMMRVAPANLKAPQHRGAGFHVRFLARPLSRLCLHVLASQNQEVTA